MSRKVWIALGIAAGSLFVLMLAAGGGFLLYRQHQTRQWLAEGHAAFEEGDWDMALRRYAFYLGRERDDIEVLERYAHASLRQGGNRRNQLSQASTAYRQILHHDPSREDIERELFELQKRLGAWHEVHYMAGRMLVRDPENTELMHDQAFALDRLGNRNDAIAAYRELIDQGVAEPTVFLNLARLFRETNLIQQAESVLEQAVAMHPDEPEAYVVRGEYFLEDRDLQRAGEELERAKALSEDDLNVLILEARYALANTDYDTAIARAQEVLERDPSHARTYLVLAQAYAETGDREASLAVLRDVDPEVRADNPELFVNLAERLIQEQLIEEAREVIATYETLYPAHQVPLNYLRGRELLITGDVDAAADSLTAAIERNPGMAPARFFLAVAQLLQGNNREARGHLEIYLRENPADENARSLLAEAMGVQPDVEQVLQAAQTMLVSEDARPEALVSSALALLGSALREGTVPAQLETIEGLFNRAIERNPVEARAYGGLTDAYVAAGDTAKARATLERAELQEVPAEQLARAYANLALAEGDTGAAWDFFQQAIVGENATLEDARQWSRFFSVREQPELARRALAEGAERFPAEPQRADLAVERVLLELRLGEEENALRLIDEAQPMVTGHEEAEQALNRIKGQVAWRLMEQGDRGRIEEVRRILAREDAQLEDTEPMLLALQGMMNLYAAPPDYDGAENAFRSALEQDDESIAALMGMATVASARGALSRALEFATQASAVAPQSEAIDIWRANVLFRMQRYLEARDLLERVLSDRPGNPPALELLINTYIATNQPREAERILDTLTQRIGDDETRTRVLDALRGQIMLARGNTSEAEAILRKQYAANPGEFSIVRSLASALAQQGRLEEAEEILQTYVESHENDAEAFAALARFYLGTNEPAKIDAASTALTRALTIDNNFLPALRVLVDLQVRRGARAGILAACNRYLQHDPLNADVLFAKASALSREPGREEEAFAALDTAIRQERRPDYLALRGMLHLRSDNYTQALNDLQQASLDAADTSAEFDAALAETYWGLDEPDLAQTYYESALAKATAHEGRMPPWLSRLGEKLGREN